MLKGGLTVYPMDMNRVFAVSGKNSAFMKHLKAVGYVPEEGGGHFE